MFTTEIENTDVSTESCENPVIELIAVTDDDLVTVTGGRNYGWQGGGWINNGGGGLGNGGVLPSVDGGNVGDDGGATSA